MSPSDSLKGNNATLPFFPVDYDACDFFPIKLSRKFWETERESSYNDVYEM